MIVSVTTPSQRAQFLVAAEQQIATRAQMSMRLALFGDLQGSGWHFYTSECVPEISPLPPLAVALRGASATVAGEFDPEELGSFLQFLGVECITTPSAQPPEGYALRQTLTAYTLVAGQMLPVPLFTGDFTGQNDAHRTPFALDKEPSVLKLVPLLFAEESEEVKDQYYADNTLARNAGMAEFWLLSHDGTPIFTLAASAVVGQSVYLSAGETIEAYRGQGIGGHYIVQMANEYAAKGYEVCFVCEAVRCRFYERLGFAKAGVLYQYALCG